MSDYVWQRCLNVSEIDSTGYHENTRKDLVDLIDFIPETALDIGCAAGGTGAYFKSKFPGSRVWGIELNQDAAKKAAEKLDFVASDKFEDIDLDHFGITPGSLDVVFVADVLEHMYDPWAVMVKLKPYLSDRGRIILSIPNIRYLPLMDDLAHGYFRYADFGVLDITHLRFFTLKELKRFVVETGYSIKALQYGLDSTLRPMMEQYRQQLPCTIDTGKLVLRNVDEAELMELFSGQFFLVLSKELSQLTDYAPPKMGCYFWKGENDDYQKFLTSHKITKAEAAAFDKRVETWGSHPLIDVYVACNRQTLPNLPLTIQSLATQLYHRIRIVVLGDGPAPAELAQPGRIRWVNYSELGPFKTINQLTSESIAEWTMVLQSGDQVLEHALIYMLEKGMAQPDAQLIYGDEDALALNGSGEKPLFKPDFLPEYLEYLPYIGDFTLVRQSALQALDGFDCALEDAAFYDLQLSIYRRFGTRAIAHVPDVLFRRFSGRSLETGQYTLQHAEQARQKHLNQLCITAEISSGKIQSSALILPQPRHEEAVTLIINADMVQSDLVSLLEQLEQAHKPFPVVVFFYAGATVPADTRAVLEAIDAEDSPSLRVFALDAAMTETAAINALINMAETPWIFLWQWPGLPTDANWLSVLLGKAQRPGVVAVTPRLMDVSGSIVGNQLLLGVADPVLPVGHGLRHEELGYLGQLSGDFNPSAISFDAVLMRRESFLASGGLDTAEPDLLAACVALCLTWQKNNQRIVWTAVVNLVVHGKPALNLAAPKADRLLTENLAGFAADPAYNRNMSRVEPFQLTTNPDITRLQLPWKPLPKIYAFPGDSMGCGHYRVIEPVNAALTAGLVDGYCSFQHLNVFDLAASQVDTLYLQRQITDEQMDVVRRYRKFHDSKLVFELDDLITNLPVANIHKQDLLKDLAKRLRATLAMCDRFVVTTPALAEAYRDFHQDIVVVPNRLDANKWLHLEPKRNIGHKPRVGWAGGVSHSGDLALIVDVVKELASEVDWVFLGMCPESIRSHVKEFYPGVPTPDYPAKLASLNLDLAIAPLEHNEFNACKSNLKVLEYGMLGYPVVASDFGPYQGDLPILRVKNRHKDWVAAIRESLSNMEALATQGDKLRARIRQDFILQDHLDEWMAAWFQFKE